jgi:alpha-beta hydrolase superfamily lysophospholipase
MPTPIRGKKWVVASAIFSCTGMVVIALMLWAARGRSTVSATPGGPAPKEEEVRFQAAGNTLTGTLTVPGTKGPHPAVVLVSGSGAADRTEHGLFPAIVQHLARRGFACLTWDRPGVGRSTGDFENQTFADRAEEALAAVAFLRTRSEVRHDRVGLWGFSQGAAVVPLAAAQSGDVAFVIEVSGCQLPTWKQDPYRVEGELRADGFSESAIQEALDLTQMRVDLMRGSGSFEELDETQKGTLGKAWFEYFQYTDRKRFVAGQRTVGFDPGPSWEKVRCPVLSIHGEKDTLAPVEASIAVVKQALEKAGNSDLTVKIFPRADHRLAVSATGGRKEAADRAKTRPAGSDPDFAPGYLDTMSDWLLTRFAAR